jgi:hypothetical protein
MAYAAILSRTVNILKVAHNGSGYIVLADARTFHEFWEGESRNHSKPRQERSN